MHVQQRKEQLQSAARVVCTEQLVARSALSAGVRTKANTHHRAPWTGVNRQSVCASLQCAATGIHTVPAAAVACHRPTISCRRQPPALSCIALRACLTAAAGC